MKTDGALLEVKRRTLVDQVVDNLLSFIIKQKLNQGDRLPTEIELASQLKVGRGTIREAVMALSFAGIVEVRPRVGIRLRTSWSRLRSKPLKIDLFNKKEKLKELIESRIMLEQVTVELAAKKANKTDINKLRKCLDAVKNTPSEHWAEIVEKDMSFHFAIAKAGHNTIIERILSESRTLMKLWMLHNQPAVPGAGISDLIWRQHEDIIMAINSHNVEKARSAMAVHLHTSSENLNMALFKKSLENAIE